MDTNSTPPPRTRALPLRTAEPDPTSALLRTHECRADLIAAFSLSLFALAGFAAPASAQTSDKAEIAIAIDERGQRAAGIATSPVDIDTLGQDLSFPGTVVVPPHQASVVASPAAGMVEAVLVAMDEPVKAGQLIARLRSPQVVEAQHLYLASLTDEKLAADKLRRADALFKVKAMSEVQLVLAQGEHTHALARVDERLQIVQLLGVSPEDIDELRKTRKISNSVDIRAPKDGTVIDRTVKQGTRVDAAAPLFTIATLSPLWVNIQVPTTRMAFMEEGRIVSLPAQGARGRVIRIGRTIDPATQSIGVVAEVGTNAGSVRPGLATSVSIRIDSAADNRWAVPIAAVVRHRGSSWIFIQEANGFRAKPVEVVSETGQRASLRANLKARDRIATQGVLALVAELAENDER
jgi:RND family efflux transporter MFP subunit